MEHEVLAKLREGRDVLLSVDVQGVAAIRAKATADTELKQALITVFLTPASIATLEQRLRKRGTDPEEVIQDRLSKAREEIAKWKLCDYLIISTTIAEDLRRMHGNDERVPIQSLEEGTNLIYKTLLQIESD